jgi:hypothetical protein
MHILVRQAAQRLKLRVGNREGFSKKGSVSGRKPFAHSALCESHKKGPRSEARGGFQCGRSHKIAVIRGWTPLIERPVEPPAIT